MDAAAWQAEFARRQDQREQVWRDERQALWDRVGASQKHESHSSDVGKPVVLKMWEADEDDLPTAAQRVLSGAFAAGWSARAVASLAAVPASGLVTVVTVRCRRHDERLWAAWRDGRFDVAWYVGATGLERIGSSRLSTLARSAATRAAKAGVEVKAPTIRGLLDVIEGVRGPRQWVDVLERQELDRAVGTLAVVFPGLCLTRQ